MSQKMRHLGASRKISRSRSSFAYCAPLLPARIARGNSAQIQFARVDELKNKHQCELFKSAAALRVGF
jgi:hypothetical protein